MLDPARPATRYAPAGMVASPDYLASEAGLVMMRSGGGAADAAVAASAVLAVTSPHLCGMGGDLWALVHPGPNGPPAALNASGRAGSGADADRLRQEGEARMPFTGDIRSVTVPGCVDGWVRLHQRFGRLSLREVLEPARTYAREGFPASPLLAALIPLVNGVDGAEDLLRDPPVRPGDRVLRPGCARALEAIGEHGREGFYDGDFGRALRSLGAGEYTSSDLARSQADWVDPISVDVWGGRLWTVPPNSQGYLTLAGAWLANRLDLPADDGDPQWAHLLIEAARRAAADRPAVLHERAMGADLLEPDRLEDALSLIDPDRRTAVGGPAIPGDTIYLAAVDADRTGVSLIQSNASGFGAGLVAPDTGIFLHNRGIGFSLEPGHPAEYGPGRRPPSTLSPALVTGVDGTLRAVVGTMGGDAQPQILLQVLARFLGQDRSPASAVAAARWVLARPDGHGFDTWEEPDRTEVRVEADAPAAWSSGLTARGHRVRSTERWSSEMGHAHLISVVGDEPGSVLAGVADPRAATGGVAGY